MDTEKSILKKVATAIYNGDFNAFEQTILPLLNFEDADENNAPTTSNPDLSTLLKNFCDEDASYDENHLDLLEAPDPYFLCEWVDKTQDPSPCPDYDEWEWESIGGVRNAQELAYDDPMYDEHEALIEILYDKYADSCFDYISYGRQLAENNAYCVGEYGYIPHHAENAQRFHACQFSKTDVCTLGLYAAGLLGKYSSLASSNDKLSPIPARNLAPSLLQRLESCGIVLEDVPDYEQSITTKHEEKRPFDPSIFDRIVCAYKPPAERVNSSLADDLKAATEAANRQQQQAAPKAQSHNQKL